MGKHMSIDYVKLITALAGHAAVAWSLVFAAPHLWWALGVSAAFPGGDTAYSTAFRNSWFLLYNLVVVILLSPVHW